MQLEHVVMAMSWDGNRCRRWLRYVAAGLLGPIFLVHGLLGSGTAYTARNTSYGSGVYASYFKDTSSFVGAQLSDGDTVQGWVTFGNNAGIAMSLTVSGTVGFWTAGRIEGTLASDGTASLQLHDDLWCSSNFATTGHMMVQGGGYAIRLWGPLTLTGANCWEVSTGTYLASPYSGNLILDGQWSTVTLNGACALRIDSGVSVTLRNVNLVVSNLRPFSFADHSSILTLDNVNVTLNVPGGGTYQFDSSGGNNGQFWIANNVVFGGVGASAPTTFSYNSNYTMGINQGGLLTVGDGIGFSYGSSTNGRLVMIDATSKLRFDNCSLVVPSGVGMQVLKGMVLFDNLCHIVNTGATSSTGGVVFGDGSTSGNDVDVRLLAGATLIVDGYMQYNHS